MVLSMAESGRGKSYSDAQNERFRAAARTLVEREGSATAAAKLLGVSQPTLSNFLNGRTGAGVQLAQALARALGVGDEFVSGHARVGDPARPVLRNRPGYNEALVLAQKRAWWVPPSVWQEAGETAMLVAPAYITPEILTHAAQLVMSSASVSELEDAGREQAEAELADIEARQVEAQRLVSEAKARGETAPSVAKVMQRLRAEGEKRRLDEARARDATALAADPANEQGASAPGDDTGVSAKQARRRAR